MHRWRAEEEEAPSTLFERSEGRSGHFETSTGGGTTTTTTVMTADDGDDRDRVIEVFSSSSARRHRWSGDRKRS